MKFANKKLSSPLFKRYVKCCFFGAMAAVSMLFVYLLVKVIFFGTTFILYEDNLLISSVELVVACGLFGLSIAYLVGAAKEMRQEAVKGD